MDAPIRRERVGNQNREAFHRSAARRSAPIRFRSFANLGVAAVALPIFIGTLAACADADDRSGLDASAADAAVDPSCDPDTIAAATYAACRCTNPAGPPVLGAEENCPEYAAVLVPRVCMVDSSCNVYPFLLEDARVTMVGSPRDDVAIRWEWGAPLPSNANLALNAPDEPGSTSLSSPLSLFGKESFDPAEFPFDFQEGDEDAIPGEVIVSEDRQSITIVPTRRCFPGRWYLESKANLDAIYGDDVCDLGDDVAFGYNAFWVLE